MLAGRIEIYLGQLVFCGVLYRIGIVTEGDALFALEEDLPPDGEECVV
jgi:hypothetical protein